MTFYQSLQSRVLASVEMWSVVAIALLGLSIYFPRWTYIPPPALRPSTMDHGSRPVKIALSPVDRHRLWLIRCISLTSRGTPGLPPGARSHQLFPGGCPAVGIFISLRWNPTSSSEEGGCSESRHLTASFNYCGPPLPTLQMADRWCQRRPLELEKKSGRQERWERHSTPDVSPGRGP